MRTIIVFICLLAAGPARAATAEFTRTPGGDVMVGEEVLFDAGASTGGTDLLGDGTFEWDFGDGYFHKRGEPHYWTADGGVSVTHYFMATGTYTVTLVVTDGDSAVDSATTEITVTGTDPQRPPIVSAPAVIDLKMDGDLNDRSGNSRNGSWTGGSGSFVKGREEQAARTGTAYITIPGAGTALNNAGAVSISLLARKNTMDSEGYLLDVGSGQLSLFVDGGLPSSSNRTITFRLTTSAGVRAVSGYLADQITNTGWHQYGITYDGDSVHVYVDGVIQAKSGHSGALSLGSADLTLAGRSGADAFDGFIDEVRIYPSALTVEQIFTGFELWHADYFGHLAQYVYAQVPEGYRSAGYSFEAVLQDGGGGETVLYQNGAPDAVETFLLDQRALDAGTYTVQARILDGTDVVDEVLESFTKGCDGIPGVAINEHNAICMDGEPFFPIFPWGLGSGYYSTWYNNQYINSLCGSGWGSQPLSSWQSYLDAAETVGLPFIGPAMWDGLPGTLAGGEEKRNADVDMMRDFVDATKDHAALMAWCWVDEPDLGGSYHTTVPVLRSWNYICHQADPHHPVYTNIVGYPFGDNASDYSYTHIKKYCYSYNAERFGGKRSLMTDIYGFDYYPYEYIDNEKYSMYDMAAAVDRVQDWNYGLVPFIPWVEVCDIETDDDPPPTAAQLKHLIWLNVVHGAKGIAWFNHFGDIGTERYAVMREFGRQVKALTPVVLGPESGLGVSDNANDPGRMVDFMVRESADSVYIFAVRLTEPSESGGAAIDVTFSASRLASGDITVYGEDRTVSAGTGTFTDSFETDAVHIYAFPQGMLGANDTRSAVRIPRFELRGAQPYRSLDEIRVSGDVERVSVYGGDGGLLGLAPVKNGRAVWNGTLRSGVYYIGVDGVAGTYRKIMIVEE